MDISKYRDNTELSDIVVEVGEQKFNLHKFPLSISSEYFKNQCKNESKIKLDNFPGGKENFEKIVDHCYGKDVELTNDNVASVLDGAEYLEMNGKNNLVDKCEKFIDRIFRTTEYSRNIEALIELVECSLDYNDRQKQLKEKAANLIIQIWLRPFTSYKNNRKDQYLEDTFLFNSLLELEYSWIIKMIQAMSEDENKHYYIGRLVVEYMRYNLLNVQAKLKKSETENGHRSSQDNLNGSVDGNESSDNEKEGDKMKNKNKSEIFDEIIEELPDSINIGQYVTVDWLKEIMEFCNKNKCKQKPKLLQICGGMLTYVTPKEVQSMDQKDIKEMIDEALKSEKMDAGLMKWIWEHHLLDMATKGEDNKSDRNQDKGSNCSVELDAELFCKVVKNMPEHQPVDPDVAFEIAMVILDKSDDKKDELLSCVDLEKISIDNLKAALDSKHWDPECIADMAIKRLKKNNDTFKFYGSSDFTNLDFELDRFKDSGAIHSPSSPTAIPYRSSWKRSSPIISHRISGMSNGYSGNDSSYLYSDDILNGSPKYYPTYRSIYSPDCCMRLEDNLRRELKRITDSYSKYPRDRYSRSKSRKRYNYYNY